MKQISAIILAAGFSRRFGPHNKLLSPIGDSTVIRKTTEAVCKAGLGEVIAVLGHEGTRVEQALNRLPLHFVLAKDYEKGMGNSIAAGVRAASKDAMAFAIIPGDLPYLKTDTIQQICQLFIENGDAKHVIPCFRGTRGHPVVLGSWLRKDLENLEGNTGAKILLSSASERSRTCWLNIDDDAIIRDIDFP